jgi:hypothetical protein
MENIIEKIKENNNKIFDLKKENKNLEKEYANNNRKFKKGDVVVNKEVKDTTFIIEENAEYLYSSGIIYYDATIITTTNPLFLGSKDTTFSLPEIHLTIQSNG